MPKKSLPLLALALLSQAAWAQSITPGLWENAITVKSGSGQMESAMARMQEQLAKMPPEQRKMVEDMMAKQGVGIGAAAGKPTTVRVCISKEQAEKVAFAKPQDGRCKQDSLERSGSTVKFKFSCTEPPGSGEGEYTLKNDKSYSGRMVMTTMASGKPERMEMQQVGTWISADCGALKPR